LKVLVLGTGKMGYGLLKDLVAQKEVEEVVAADENVEAPIRRRSTAKKVKGSKLDVTDRKDGGSSRLYVVAATSKRSATKPSPPPSKRV
jgi:saccharopine dehydrogenase-like NADP-dependent oxidoreductase